MDPHAIEVLEFDQVRRLLAGVCSSPLGEQACLAIEPSTNLDLLHRWQTETSEARYLLDHGEPIPLAGVHDLHPLLRTAAIGSTLSGEELHEVGDTLRCVGRVRAAFDQRHHTPELRAMTRELVDLPELTATIEHCIGDDGEVVDDASSLLRGLRRQIRLIGERIEAVLRRILAGAGTDEAVQDAVVTMREGRYCIPVKASHRGKFDGLVHDRSASGQTVFMEPAAVVNLNNELRDAQLAERQEVHRILSELTATVAAEAPAIEHNLTVLTRLDCARARGRLSQRLRATEPELNTTGVIVLVQARHPLLAIRDDLTVVPVDLRLGDGFTTLLVTGPNTGGKTVSLKTIGLLTLMAQCGLHVPAEPGSRLAVCREVFADIGDEQSIEQSLSTFSAHLAQITRVLTSSQPGDLVLLDEVGAGTDPTEGAALAQAVLAALHQRGCLVMATTHHGRLKAFAYDTPGVENASVEFDPRSLAPTYRLLIGIPGASHALDIAARLGLPAEVIDAARALIPAGHQDASTMIAEMQQTRQRMETELRSAQHEAASASHQRRELERMRQQLADREREIRDEANRQAAALLADIQAQAKAILDDLRRAPRENRQTEQARQRLRGLEQRLTAPASPPPAPTAAPEPTEATIEPGDTVELVAIGREAKVIGVDSDGHFHVQVGPMHTTVDRGGLRLRAKAKPAAEPVSRGRRDVADLASGLVPEVHLRGQTVDEALIELDRYLDRALLAGSQLVRVVHGKGTGALRKAVWDYLKGHPHVAGYVHPPQHEGGRGVTMVTLT